MRNALSTCESFETNIVPGELNHMASISSSTSAPRANPMVWLPAMFAVAVICFESRNSMGGDTTGVWLSELIRWTGHNSGAFVEELNHVLRKGGHFTGYGLLGLCFSRAWLSLLRSKMAASWTASWAMLRFRAGTFGVLSAMAVATCDEVHQIFLPTRFASGWDVILDTSGAITLNLLVFAFIAVRRRKMMNPETGTLTTLQLSIAALPKRRMVQRAVAQSAVAQRTMRRADVLRSRTPAGIDLEHAS
jgi:VanZ family protein